MSKDITSVTVAVRVRPFNEREANMGEKLCVSMEGKSTTLTCFDTKERNDKTFSYDYSFWSHDGFVEDEDGVYLAANDKYATQDHVFSQIGIKVLDRAWEGYHCCLFAYGQTGAGKSYSMVGYGANPGIVPISCREIFQRIEANKDPALSFEVTVSMLEIYNEKVQDLLCNPKDRPQGGLDIRENKQLGVYVKDLANRAVDSYEAIEQVVEQGTHNRTVASTLMNATSSRAHTVLLIDIKQISRKGDLTGVKHSTTYLVDLAGSEKTSKTGVSGDRLKEGCAINKSLTCLGNVIEKLADKSGGKNVTSIPYRDSKLTRLLQNALGGSCMTVMMVAISPAQNNYEESLSTLRYADRAKRIQNVAVINENPQDRLIRQLREENAKLLEIIEKGKSEEVEAAIQPDLGSTWDAKELEDRLESERKRYEADVAERAAEVKVLEEALATMQQDFKERVKESKKTMEKTAEPFAKDTPHFSNLHEDSQLTGKLHYMFPKDKEVVLGKKPIKADDGPAPDIILAGLGVYLNHCKVVHTEGGVFFTASKEAVATTFVNGDNFRFNNGADPVKLEHGDRVVIGQNYVFVFSGGQGETGEQLILHGKVSFDGAKQELCEKQGDIQMKSEEELKKEQQREKEFERRLEAANVAKLKIQHEAEALIKEREREFREKMELMQKQFETLADCVGSAVAQREVNEMRETSSRFFSGSSAAGGSNAEISTSPSADLKGTASVDVDSAMTPTNEKPPFSPDMAPALETLDSAPIRGRERVMLAGGEELENSPKGPETKWKVQLEDAAEVGKMSLRAEENAMPMNIVVLPTEQAAPPAEAPAPAGEVAGASALLAFDVLEKASAKADQELSPMRRKTSKVRNTDSARVKNEWAKEQNLREEEWAAERLRREQQLKKMQRDFEERQRKAEKEARRQLEEIERRSRILSGKADERRMHDMDQARINEQLLIVLPMVKEANAISKELSKNIQFKPQLLVEPDERGHVTSKIRVSVVKKPENVVLFLWPSDTMENRLFLMRELLEQWCNDPSFDANSIPCEEDPFWDPLDEERYVGCARLFFESLTWQLETEVEARIIGADGHLNHGSLQLELWPVDANHEIGIADSDVIEYPEDLLENPMEMKFLLGVNQYVGASTELEDIRCEFQYRFHEPKSIHAARDGAVVDFTFEEIISELTDADLLDYFTYSPMYFRLYGKDRRQAAVHEAWTKSLSERATNDASNHNNGLNVTFPAASHASPKRKLLAPLIVELEDTMNTQNSSGTPLWNPNFSVASPNAAEKAEDPQFFEESNGLDATLISVSPPLWQPLDRLDETLISVASVLPARPKLDAECVGPDPGHLNVLEHNHSRTNLGEEMARVQEQLKAENQNNIGAVSALPATAEDPDMEEPMEMKDISRKWSMGSLLGSSKSANKYKESSKSSKACVIQ